MVLIVCDQFRGDCLGYAGHPDVKTPYLDTLAAQGTFFENGYSACPSCIPARASLLTGKTPRHTGRVGYQDGIAWRYDHMMAEEFSEAGYQTACVGKMHVHPLRLACGFQTLRLHDGYIGHYRKANLPHWMHQDVSDDYLRFLSAELGPASDVNGTGVENNSWIARPWVYEERLHPTNWVVDESIRFLETRDRTRPFFLMASFVRPHPPFDAPAAYYQPYLDRELREPTRGDWDDENTIVLFRADHGEMLFDHCTFRKVLPYEGSAHVPFIVRVGSKVLPGGRPRPRTSDAVVDLMDVMPTLLDLAGVEVPEGVDGSSLRGEITGEKDLGRAYVHGEHSRDYEQSNQYIVTSHDKYVWFTQSGVERYFDLDADPREERDLSGDPAYAERVAELRAILIEELRDREEGYVQDGGLVVGRKPRVVLEQC